MFERLGYRPPHPARAGRRRFILLALAAALGLAVCALSACGGSNGKVVASVGKSEITQTSLAHWMETMVGGDYRELNAETSPQGLVSDPPDYSRCVQAAKQIPTTSGKHLSEVELHLKCRQLYTVVKEQALSFLISELWAKEQAAAHGLSVSEAELNRAFGEFRSRQWPSPAQLKRYLSEQHRSLSDERALFKRNLLGKKTFKALEKQAGDEQSFVKLVKAENAKLTARTECKAGYRSLQCRQYASGKEAAPSAAVLVEQLKAGGK
jgi:hypothetical protein